MFIRMPISKGVPNQSSFETPRHSGRARYVGLLNVCKVVDPTDLDAVK